MATKKKLYKIFRRYKNWDWYGNFSSRWNSPYYSCPDHWTISAGCILTSNLDENIHEYCAEGVHFANREWVREFFLCDGGRKFSNDEHPEHNTYIVYEVKPLGNVIDPVTNDGNNDKKYRTDKLKLVRRLTKKQAKKVFGLGYYMK